MKIQPVNNRIYYISKHAKNTIAALMLATAPVALQAKNADSFDKTEIAISQSDTNEEASRWNKIVDGAHYILLLYGLAYAGIVTNRFIKKPKINQVAKNFSEIYRRDVSADEAEKMCQRYKKIFDIKNEKEFQQTLFEQVKKDYGLEETKWNLHTQKMNLHTGAYFSPPSMRMKNLKYEDDGIYVNTRLKPSRIEFFLVLIHELNHAKQYQIAYMTNADALAESTLDTKSLFNNLLEMLKMTNKKELRKNLQKNEITDEEMCQIILEKTGTDISKMIQNHKDNIINELGTTKPNSLSKGSKEHNLGLSYIENYKNYINNIFRGYYKQTIEKESFHVQKIMKKSCDYFLGTRQMFRLPF